MDVKNKFLKQNLTELFGYKDFRGNQQAIIEAILDGKNVFVIMPTGAGKSLCYQLPAIMGPGIAIVVSPLIALMKNQVDQLRSYGFTAHFLNSSLSRSEIQRVKKESLQDKVKLLYVAPESLAKGENVEFLKQLKLAFVAVDEAHCISEWGHDFRPEYRKIRSVVDSIGNLPLIALTATATPKVQLDIQKNLGMADAVVFKSSFNRPNLFYEVRPKRDVDKNIIKFIKGHPKKSGIIYCLSRKKVEEVAELLKVNGIKALPYHAGLEQPVRMKNQDDFLNENVDIIVATIAFGMGIDKPDVRFVIHYDVPKSIEGYYQETGRSGRDGLEGNCIMFYSYNDIIRLEKFMKDKTVMERETGKYLLDQMASYSESSVCRRKQLLHYFGEIYDLDNCGRCDNCLHPKPKFEAKDEVLLLLNTVRLTEERFGAIHLVNVIRGVVNPHVVSYLHDRLEVFGKGSNEDVHFWNSILHHTLMSNLMYKDIQDFGVFKLTEEGRAYIKKPRSIEFTKDHDYDKLASEEPDIPMEDFCTYDQILLDKLKALRKKIAKEKNVPPFVIFQDPSLEEMATKFPITKDQLGKMTGVGMGKVMKYGDPFLNLINSYVEENEIEVMPDIVVKSAIKKSQIKVLIIQQVDKKVGLNEIADSKNLEMTELMHEIEQIVNSGTKLNLDYYIDSAIDEDRQELAYEYFMKAETDDIQTAVNELEKDGFTEEEIRLMRIKFMCEMAQ
ncbi:MAG: ATP-dependent DNA helicase RecQ [Bacteroidetes bacterium RIFCSPLOWO2_02_FULL_36_8]|nr:MAG: ATP-dependent DNA helicase RecQ [Bacteroidetes bacterium RIFCSPLOWO2_02_FULL_36_8]OFY68787.1 MAG: ATP-dependent DNA helicase RecQ [Bacteroidetes bacterium RIFCSPLOWO2_12_FULL_37_12]